MSRQHGRRGSLQFWPRKRARRPYAQVNWSAVARAASRGTAHGAGSKEIKPLGFAAWKAGMTHFTFTQTVADVPPRQIARAATILEAPALYVAGFRAYEKTQKGLRSAGEEWFQNIPKELEISRKTMQGKKKAQLDIDKICDVRLLVATQPKKSGMHKLKPDVLEIALAGVDANAKIDYARSMLGKEFRASEVFGEGEFVDVSAVTKGHGFTGTIKRFGIRIQGRKSQQMHRHPGSIGGTTPRKVNWRVPMAGQYGFFERTEYNKRLLMLGSDGAKINAKGGLLGYGLVKGDFMLVEGSVPGSRKRLVVVRRPARIFRKAAPVAIEYISTESKQGAR